MMAAHERNCIRVTKLPHNDVTEDELRILFRNKRNQGGGPVKNVILNTGSNSTWALIYFEEEEAVTRVLSKGNTVTIKGQQANVELYEEQKLAPVARQQKAPNYSKFQDDTKAISQTKIQRLSKPLESNQRASEGHDPHWEGLEEEPDFESVVKRTIKATIRDVSKSKESYILYLEDTSVSQGPFDEDSLFIDCFRKKLYVTFDDEEGAVDTCTFDHNPEDSNFEMVEMASGADFEIYENRVSVHGECLRNLSRKQFLSFFSNRTETNINSVIHQEEPRSAILVFEEKEVCQGITELCWQLKTEFHGEVVPAPVFKTRSVSVTGLPREHGSLLRRYMSNRRSGGGPLDSVEWWGNSAIVTFKTENDYEGVLQRKEPHTLEGFPLKLEPYYHCLSKAAYQEHIDPSSLSTLEEMPVCGQRSSVSDFNRLKEEDEAVLPKDRRKSEASEYAPAKEEILELDKKDAILLEKTDVLENLQRRFPRVQITLYPASHIVKIVGNPSDVGNICLCLLKLTREFFSQKIDGLSSAQIELLKTDSLLHEMNAVLRKDGQQAVLEFEGSKPTIYFVAPKDQSVSVEALINMVKHHVTEETKALSDPHAGFLLDSEHGRRFLADLCKASDGSGVNHSRVIYDASKNSVSILAPKHKLKDLNRAIDVFMKGNMIAARTVKYSPGKLLFVMKYRTMKIQALRDKVKPKGISIQNNANGFEVKGKKEDVISAEEELVTIRDSVFAEDFTLRFFGIKEYLSEAGGDLIKSNVQSKHSCCILPAGEAIGGNGKAGDPGSRGSHSLRKDKVEPLQAPRTVATASMGGYTVHFMQGDLLGLKVDAIVNPVDEARKLASSSSLGRALLVRGGDQIQADLLRAPRSGPACATGSGSLDNCKSILHVVLPAFNSDGGSAIKTAMTACLNIAAQMRLTSVGFPTLGNGKNFKYPDLAVSIQMMNAIKEYIEQDATTPGDIFLCDKSEDTLSALLDRCEQTFPDTYIDHISLPKQGLKKGPVPAPRRHSSQCTPKDFGPVKVKIHEGEITRWRIDAIVIAVDKSLNLNKGTLAKIVLKHGGQSIQDELDDNYSDGLGPGEVGQSSGGNLKCKHILYVFLAHWKGDSESQKKASEMQTMIEKVLEAAEKIPVSSIAIPALGTGNLHYPPDLIAQVFSDAIQSFSKKNPKPALKTVDIVIYKNAEVLNVFQSKFSDSGTSSAKVKATHDNGDEEDAAAADDDDDGEKDAEADDNHGQNRGAFGFLKSAAGTVMKKFFGDSHNSITYGSVTLTVKKGDITLEKCDAIVNSIKSSMSLSASGAVCKTLLKKCGTSLQDECTDQQSAMQQSGVAETSAPGLPCQKIYHVSMEMFGSKWDKGVLQVLTQAEDGGASSIALPLLGSGARNPNMDQIKKRFLAGVEQFGTSRQSTTLTDIRLIIFSQEMFDFFVGNNPQKVPSSSRHAGNKSPPKVPAKSNLRISDRADVKIYANDPAHADKVKKELIFSFKRAFREHRIKNDKIKQLNSEQMQDLENTACKLRVHLAARTDEGLVVLRSFFPMEQVIAKHSLLMEQVLEKHHQALLNATPTAIVWQFREKEKWRNFEPLMNVQIEKSYKQKSPDCEVTDCRNHKYKLDFKKMEEYSMKEDGSLSRNGVKIRRFDKTKVGEPLPTRWERMSADENLKMVQVKKGGEEFTRVENLFRQGGATFPVKSIQRIQNKFLYQQYRVKMREMEQRNGKDFQNEKRLFHGTSPTSMAAINQNGFSNNYAGAHATAHGNGTYFAVTSQYSVSFSQPDSHGTRHMYLVRVLAGKSTVSTSGMKHLPYQPGTTTPYDSGTDGAKGMYVIFHDAQMYPEYLISF